MLRRVDKNVALSLHTRLVFFMLQIVDVIANENARYKRNELELYFHDVEAFSAKLNIEKCVNFIATSNVAYQLSVDLYIIVILSHIL